MKWFLIKKNEHLGPFSESTLNDMLKKGEIQEESLVWCDGWKNPKSYSDAFSEFPPDLPLPSSFDEGKKEPLEKKQPLELLEPSQSLVEESGKKPLRLDFKKKTILYFMSLLVCATVSIGLFYQRGDDIFSRPKFMLLKDFERLKDSALKKDSPLNFSVALGRARRSLWLATNNPLRGEVFVTLKTIKGQVLGEPVEVRAKGVLNKKLVTLVQPEFVLGARYVDGFYTLEVLTQDNLEEPFFKSFFSSPRESKINFIGKVLITSLSKKDFKKQLVKFQKSKQSNTKLFWEELAQKYQTVKMITGQIQNHLSLIFDGDLKEWNKKISRFESKYKSEYGIFFTEFVKTNEKSYQRLLSKNFEDSESVLASYNHLSRLAIEIGEESMKVLESLQGFEVSTAVSEDLEKLRAESLLRLTEIMAECDLQLSQLSVID